MSEAENPFRAEVLDDGAGPVLAATPIRGRTILGHFLVALVGSFVLTALIWPEWLDRTPGPLPSEPFASLLLASTWAALTWRSLLRRGRSPRALLGPLPSSRWLRWSIACGVALVFVGTAGFFLWSLSLSFAFPTFVEEWLLDDPIPTFLFEGPWALPGTLANLLVEVGLMPALLQVIFHGILLQQWSGPQGRTGRGLLWTSLAMGLLSGDLIGGTIFGYVTGVAYLRSGRLSTAILAHVVHNALVRVVILVGIFGDFPPSTTVEQLLERWWIGALALVVAVPFTVLLLRRMPAADAPPPIPSSDPLSS